MAVVNVAADKAVYVDAYDFATVNTLTTPINFASIHAGGSFGTQTVSVKNTGPNSSYTELLAAGFCTPSTGITASGSIAGLAGQATDNTTLLVGISDTTAGAKSGTVVGELDLEGCQRKRLVQHRRGLARRP